jgi:hypothetical protein
MRPSRAAIVVLCLAIACTATSSTTGSLPASPSATASATTLAGGAPLPAGCTGRVQASETVAFVAGERAWAMDPLTHRLACLFTTTDPGPFAWGPQGDRVLLGNFQVQGLDADAPNLSPLGTQPATFDWGHPIGLAIVFAGSEGQPEKRFTDTGTVERLRSMPSGTYLQIAYHPSGLALGFILEGNGKQAIWISTNEGDDPQRLVFAEAGTTFTSIAFSPDGKRLWWIAQHGGGYPVLHWMSLGDRTTFTGVWRGRDGTSAHDLKIAPNGLLKSVNEGTGCGDSRALVIAGGSASRAMPFETRPTSAIGWLDDSTLLVAAGGCGTPTELFAVDAHLGGAAAALVTGVDMAAPRTILVGAPISVPEPGSDIVPPPGGLG